MAIIRETCVFYASWFEAIETLPKAIQGEAYRAIMMYALRGAEAEEQGQMTKLIMAMVKPVIDTNNKRFENGCKGGEFGKLGGRPRKAENPKITPRKPQNNPKETPLLGLGVSENENENENENGVCENNTHTHEEIFQKFKIQCEKVAPLALAFKEPLTVEQFTTLYDTYGWQKIAQCATELHNKEACYHNRRAYTAWKAFMAKIK